MERNERALLMAIAKLRWPGAKKDLLLYLLANDSGAALGTILPQVATSEETGMSPSTARQYFLELVDERVLIRFDGAGTRGHAFRINWRFDEWRVPWLRAQSVRDDRAPAKREAALAHLAAILHPPADRKPGFVARPVARQEPIAARSGASLFGPSDATSRATTGPVAARTAARQADGAIAADTIPSTSRPHSLTEGGSENSQLLLATITERAGAPIFGQPARAVRQLVDEAGDVTDLVAAVHRAPPGLKISAYVELIGQAHARRGLGDVGPPTRPAIPEWRPLEVDDAAPVDFARERIREAREALRNPNGGTATCETATGGAQ